MPAQANLRGLVAHSHVEIVPIATRLFARLPTGEFVIEANRAIVLSEWIADWAMAARQRRLELLATRAITRRKADFVRMVSRLDPNVGQVDGEDNRQHRSQRPR